MPNPPEAAEMILQALLPPDARESVSGDLPEAYRDSRVPTTGEFGADIWYWRQVAGIWLRAYGWFVFPAVLLLAAGDVFSVFRAASTGVPAAVRGMTSPYSVVILLGAAAVYGSWRTAQWQGGFAAAFGVATLVWLFMAVWGAATFYPFARVQQSDPYWVEAWQWSIHRGGLRPGAADETFLHWLYWDNVGALIVGGLALLVTSLACGGVGAMVAGLTAQRRR